MGKLEVKTFIQFALLISSKKQHDCCEGTWNAEVTKLELQPKKLV
jgi:hypothetical protein